MQTHTKRATYLGRGHLEDLHQVLLLHRLVGEAGHVLLVDLPEEFAERLQREEALVVQRLVLLVPQLERVLPQVHAPLVPAGHMWEHL